MINFSIIFTQRHTMESQVSTTLIAMPVALYIFADYVIT